MNYEGGEQDQEKPAPPSKGERHKKRSNAPARVYTNMSDKR